MSGCSLVRCGADVFCVDCHDEVTPEYDEWVEPEDGYECMCLRCYEEVYG